MRTLALVAMAAAGSLLQSAAPPATTQLLTVPQEDHSRSRMSPASASVSADGRYVALTSYARLLPADTNRHADVYVLDRASGSLTLESPGGPDASGTVRVNAHPRLSPDGRYLVFDETTAKGEGRFAVELVVRDRVTGLMTRVKQGHADGWIGSGALSDDGRVVVFASNSTTLVAGPDENGDVRDVYALDTVTGIVRRASIDSRGHQRAHGESTAPGVSGTGRYVVFTSTADLNNAPLRHPNGEPARVAHVYLRDVDLNLTRCITGTARERSSGSSYDGVISRNGRYIAFVSEATTLAPGDRNRSSDVFLHDTADGSTMLVSRSVAGGSANGASRNPVISADGRFVAFQSDASDLVCGARCAPADEDINLVPDIFVFDRVSGGIKRLSGGSTGGWMEESVAPAMSAGGDVIAFSSRHPIDEHDVDHDFDLFVWVMR